MPFRDSSTTKTHGDFFASQELLQQQEIEDLLSEFDQEQLAEFTPGVIYDSPIGAGTSRCVVGLSQARFSNLEPMGAYVVLDTASVARKCRLFHSYAKGARSSRLVTPAGRDTLTTEIFSFLNDDGEPASFSNLSDSVSLELSGLKDGWAGPGSRAPNEKTIDEIVKVLERVPSASMPSIEVEEEDGIVSLRWVAPDKQSSFSIVFRGNGRFTTVYATANPPRTQPKNFEVADEIGFASLLDDPILRALIVSE